MDINAMILDSSVDLKPSYHCHMASNPSWFHVNDDLKQYPDEVD